MSTSSNEYLNGYVANADNSWSYLTRRPVEIMWAHIVYTATATVGNRLLTLQVSDSAGNDMFSVRTAAFQTASQVQHYSFQPGMFREGSFSNGEIQVAIPVGVLMAGWTLTVFDENNIDVADSFNVSFQGKL